MWLIIVFGIVVRSAQYAFNRSIWLDEAMIALNILNRDYGALLQPLDNNQVAPVGFLLLIRFLVVTFGDSEYILRLAPFVAGLLSLVLFYRVAAIYLRSAAVPIAVGFFAILDPLIYYSSELKQYSSDVMSALLVLWIALDGHTNKLTVPRIVVLAMTGAIVLWFSHPALFVLAGVGAGMALFSLLRRDWQRLRMLAVIGFIWFASFAVNYLVALRAAGSNEFMQQIWRDSYMPLPPRSLADLFWFGSTFFRLFSNPFGLQPFTAGIAALLFLVGRTAMFQLQRERFWLLVAPIVTALLVSGFHLFPFANRVMLFGSAVRLSRTGQR